MNALAAPGDIVKFTPKFKATPLVICNGELKVKNSDISKGKVVFSGTGNGSYEVIGE
ncbi:MAG: hypothetical protein GY750_15420 [Lentisphaerae bacterium]|nr:hypothetical protein [Lentisphaerota bacterium]MCP4102788.1 hypothetical protein [Lentisphaerota bacterium]